MDSATFWATFSKTHLVTLIVRNRKSLLNERFTVYEKWFSSTANLKGKIWQRLFGAPSH
jgi:hypothetical protein